MQVVADRQHRGPVFCVAFSPDGAWLAAADYGKELRVYRSSDWEVVFVHPLSGEAYCVTFSQCSRWLAVGDHGFALTVLGCFLEGGDSNWRATNDAKDAQWRVVATHHFGNIVLTAEFSPDGSILASSDYGNKLLLLQVPGFDKLRELRLGSGARALAFTPDGAWLAVGDYDRKVTLMRSPDWNTAQTHVGASFILAIAPSPDSRFLAVGEHAKKMTLLRLDACGTQWSVERTLALDGAVKLIRYSLDGRWIVATGGGKKLQVFEASTCSPAQHHVLSSPAQCVGFSTDGRWLAAGFGDHNLVFLAAPSWDIVYTVKLTASAQCLSFSADSAVIAVGDAGKTLTLLGEGWRLELLRGSLEKLKGLADDGCARSSYCLGVALAQGQLGEATVPVDRHQAAIRFREAALKGVAGGGRVEDRLSEFHRVAGESMPPMQSKHAALIWSLTANTEALNAAGNLGHLVDEWLHAYERSVNDLASRSISLRELLRFREQHARKIQQDTETRQVVREIIVPMTRDDKVSYAEWLRNESGQAPQEADFHVIHAWGMRFDDLLTATAHAASRGRQTSLVRQDYTESELATQFWICAFCINQQRSICDLADRIPSGSPRYEMDKFESVLRRLHSFHRQAVFALDPRLMAKERIWCLDEVHECKRTGIHVLFCGNCSLEPPRRDEFKSVRECGAFDPADKERILRKIERNFSIEDFDETLFQAISEGVRLELERLRALAKEGQGSSTHNELASPIALLAPIGQPSLVRLGAVEEMCRQQQEAISVLEQQSQIQQQAIGELERTVQEQQQVIDKQRRDMATLMQRLEASLT